MTLNDLKELLTSGRFHHATYRDIGTIWEGLMIYENDDNKFNGFKSWARFGKENPDIDAAHNLVRHTGVSVGSRGRG